MPQPRRPDQRPTDQRPTVLLVNPNSDRATTASMTSLTEEALRPSGLTVRGLTAAAGPSMIVDEVALMAAARHVVHAVEEDLRGAGSAPVAVVVGAVGDPGRSVLAWRLAVHVVGIGQAPCWPPPRTAVASGWRRARPRSWSGSRGWPPSTALRVLAGRVGARG